MALAVKNPPASAGDIREVGLISGLGRSPGGEYGNPLQYSCLENPMDWGGYRGLASTVHVARRLQSMGSQRVGHDCVTELN